MPSLPARGVWVEIIVPPKKKPGLRSLPARGVWVEIPGSRRAGAEQLPSLPARGVWVEIPGSRRAGAEQLVTPREGSVG